MERFELPTAPPGGGPHVAAVSAWTPSTGARATTRSSPRTLPTTSDELTAWDPDATVPTPSSYAGLVGIGAVGGCAVTAGLGAFAGWTGAPLTFAALVGLDVGVLAGAAVGSLLNRRRDRAAATNGQVERVED